MKAILPCFKCGQTLQNAFKDSDNQPSEGTEFRTHGHYGSTFWDNFDGVELILNICDPCLRGNTDRLATQGPPHKVTTYAPMVPYADLVGLVDELATPDDHEE